MRLLVSVANAAEASAALAGGADFIDAKNPRLGALGAVTGAVFHSICKAVGGLRPVTAALGDAADAHDIEARARAFGAAGARYVKVGFAGIGDRDRALALAAATVSGAAAGQGGAILVAYADADPTTNLTAATLLDVAACVRARGVLLDTADKHGPGLQTLIPRARLAAWIDRAHERGLLVAVAGKVTTDDLPCLRDAGADIVGVRGAACHGGRTSAVSAERVRLLSERCREISLASHAISP